MTWEWVVLILGILLIVVVEIIASTLANRETYEHREGPITAPSITKRSGLNIWSYQRKE